MDVSKNSSPAVAGDLCPAVPDIIGEESDTAPCMSDNGQPEAPAAEGDATSAVAGSETATGMDGQLPQFRDGLERGTN